MSYAYSPGLKVKEEYEVTRRRILPLSGEVLVKEGDYVSHDKIVARTFAPGEANAFPASNVLGIEPFELKNSMHRSVGDEVHKGERIGLATSFFGIFKSELFAEMDGTIEMISNETGLVIIRKAPIPLEINSYIPGRVSNIIPKYGADIVTKGTFIQGIFGIGGERHGELATVAPRDDVITPDDITEKYKGKIIFGGSKITSETVSKANSLGVKGLIVGGIDRTEISKILNYDIGVAITGHESIDFSLIITEGFGEMKMAKRTYELLESLESRIACINGATQIRAGVIRPEIIVPKNAVIEDGAHNREGEPILDGINIGSKIRIIRRPNFGEIGQVISLPVELQEIETKSKVRAMEVELENRVRVLIPRANCEIIEE